MPIAALLATLYILGNFNRYNEITAMRASGISLWRLILPFLITGLILSLVSLIINEKVVPVSSLISTTIKEQKIKKNKLKNKDKIIENVAFYGKENRMFYIKSFNQKENILSDIIILEHDDKQHLKSRLTAEKAVFEKGKWKFYNAIIYPLDRTGQLISEPLFYKEKIINLPEKPDDFLRSQYQTEFMDYFQLKEYIKRFKSSGYQPIKELVDLHSKISLPFINFVIMLIGIPFALRSTRGGALIYIGVSLSIGFIFYSFIAISLALGKGGVLFPFISAWLPNIIFSICGFLMFIKINR
jgi:lipopolysaccharide export system permease protein